MTKQKTVELQKSQTLAESIKNNVENTGKYGR